MALLGFAGSFEERMLQGGSHGLGGRDNFFLGGTEQAGVGSGKTEDRVGLGSKDDVSENEVN